MQFLYPSFLWALFALAIPVVIHLFYFRRYKKVLFTNLRFLKEVKEETSNKNKLKKLLILAARILALTCVIFAFAQPFIPTGEAVKKGFNAVSIFVDNSFSMGASQGEIPLSDIALDRARSLIEAYSQDDKFQIITHDLLGRHQRLVSREEALTILDEIKPTCVVQPLSKIVNRQNQLLKNEEANKIIYLISDFQTSINDLQQISDTVSEINLVPVQSLQQRNVSIDSVWFESQIPMLHQDNKLIIRVKNHDQQDAEQVRISLLMDKEEKPVGIRDIPANGEVTDTVSLVLQSPGIHQAIIVVKDYPIQFDDKYYISFLVPDTIQVLQIYDQQPDPYLNALFEGIRYFKLSNQSSGQLNYQSLKNYQLVIFNELNTISSGLTNEINQYLRDGGKVLVFPSATADVNSYNQFFSSWKAGKFGPFQKVKKEVGALNKQEYVFKEVYLSNEKNIKLPSSNGHFPITHPADSPYRDLMNYRDGQSYLSLIPAGEGQLFLSAAPLLSPYNNLSGQAEVFVPMLYNMAITSTGKQYLSYTIASRNTVVLGTNKPSSGEFVYKVQGPTEFIPGQTPDGNKMLLDMADQIKQAGFYPITVGEDTVDIISFNYDRTESNLSLTSEDGLSDMEISDGVKLNIIDQNEQVNISSTIAEKDKGIVLWKYFLFGALLFLLLEILLIRFFNRNVPVSNSGL